MMSGTAWLHINGTDYQLNLGPIENIYDQQLQSAQERVSRMLSEGGPAIQRFDVSIGEAANTQLDVVVDNVTTAAVYFRLDPDVEPKRF